MKVNKLDLKIVRYITQCDSISGEELGRYFQRDKTNIYRSLQRSQFYLPSQKHLRSLSTPQSVSLDYLDYVSLIQQLTLSYYKPNAKERIYYLFASMVFTSIVNKQACYQQIGASISILKKDTLYFKSSLSEKGLKLLNHPKKGTELIGNELTIRLEITMHLAKLIQLDGDSNFHKKPTNTPLEQEIVKLFFENCHSSSLQIKEKLQAIYDKENIALDYNSRKFIILYLIVSQHRLTLNKTITKEDLPKLFHNRLISCGFISPYENQAFSSILFSLNFKSGRYICYDRNLLSLVADFSLLVQRSFITEIKDKYSFINDVYLCFEVIISKRKMRLYFEDKKLTNTHLIEPVTYNNIKRHVCLFENQYQIKLNHNDLASLTLLIKKHTEKNKSTDRIKKRICFISNSSHDKLGYLIEKFKSMFHVDIIDIIDINELYLIDELRIDILICFTKKIETIAQQNGYSVERIDFDSDSVTLWNFGQRLRISRAGRKIPINEFLSDINNKNLDEIRHMLTSKYKENFI